MGLIQRLLFRSRNNNDFEKKLQHLSKEEVIVHTRLKRRTQNWRKLARALIIYSILGEVGLFLSFLFPPSPVSFSAEDVDTCFRIVKGPPQQGGEFASITKQGGFESDTRVLLLLLLGSAGVAIRGSDSLYTIHGLAMASARCTRAPCFCIAGGRYTHILGMRKLQSNE
jgi:hypothetical protein